jgi:hypothetical protein
MYKNLLVLVPKVKLRRKICKKLLQIFLQILTLETKTNKFCTFKDLFTITKYTETKTKNSQTYINQKII